MARVERKRAERVKARLEAARRRNAAGARARAERRKRKREDKRRHLKTLDKWLADKRGKHVLQAHTTTQPLPFAHLLI